MTPDRFTLALASCLVAICVFTLCGQREEVNQNLMMKPFHRTVVRSGGATTKAPTSLSVMNFNVLAHKLYPPPQLSATPTVEEQTVYDVKVWENRRRLNVEHVLALLPTVLVMEEVDDSGEYYAPQLQTAAGYKWVSFAKAGGAQDSTYVFYQPDAVTLVSHKVVTLARESEEPRSQFVILCHFQPTGGAQVSTDVSATGKDFFFVAQHAKAGRTDEFERVRLLDAHRIVHEIIPEFVSLSSPSTPLQEQRILWVGDFNAGPQTYNGEYPAFTVPWILGELGQEGTQPLPADVAPLVSERSPIPFRSAVKSATGEHPLFTTCKARDGRFIKQSIDYVLFNEGSARCVGYLPCPTANPEKELFPPHFLPNPEWGSDHLSVYVELLWL